MSVQNLKKMFENLGRQCDDEPVQAPKPGVRPKKLARLMSVFEDETATDKGHGEDKSNGQNNVYEETNLLQDEETIDGNNGKENEDDVYEVYGSLRESVRMSLGDLCISGNGKTTTEEYAETKKKILQDENSGMCLPNNEVHLAHDDLNEGTQYEELFAVGQVFEFLNENDKEGAGTDDMTEKNGNNDVGNQKTGTPFTGEHDSGNYAEYNAEEEKLVDKEIAAVFENDRTQAAENDQFITHEELEHAPFMPTIFY